MSASRRVAGLQQKIYALKQLPLGTAERRQFIDREITQPLISIVRVAAQAGAKRRPGVDWERDGTDLTQEAMIACLRLLDKVAPDVTLEPRFHSVESAIFQYVRGKVRDLSFSSIGTGLAGVSGAQRRSASLHHRANLMASETGAAPDKAAVVAAENEHLDRPRGGKRIHSARATDEDFSSPVTVPITDFDDVEAGKPETDVEALRNISYDGLAATLERVLDDARRSDPELAAVAELWIPSLVAGEPLSATKIAAQLDCTADDVRTKIVRLRRRVVACQLAMCASPTDVLAAAIEAAKRTSDLHAQVAVRMYTGWPEDPPSDEQIASELGQPLTSVRKAVKAVYATISRSIVDAADSW